MAGGSVYRRSEPWDWIVLDLIGLYLLQYRRRYERIVRSHQTFGRMCKNPIGVRWTGWEFGRLLFVP
jgi:hypothetical protein